MSGNFRAVVSEFVNVPENDAVLVVVQDWNVLLLDTQRGKVDDGGNVLEVREVERTAGVGRLKINLRNPDPAGAD